MTLRPYGDTYYERCPVCGSGDLAAVWKVPFQKLAEQTDINGMAVRYFPSYGAELVYEYSCCGECEALFLNPYRSRRKAEYASDSNAGARAKVLRADDPSHPVWKGYSARYEKYMRPFFPSPCGSLVDAACGGGEYLLLSQRDESCRWERLIGLELSPIAVAHLQDRGLEAYQYDLDSGTPLASVPAGSVDFVIFSEAFEHVEFPLRSLRTLVSLLRTGGRLFFSAQRTDPRLPLRPGENQCLGEKALTMLIERLNCRPLLVDEGPGKWLVVLEKA